MDAPRFKIPLSRAILDDPAFSPDPRSHPHFSLASARSYKTKPLFDSTPPRRSTPHVPQPLFSPPSTHPRISKPPPLPVPEILPNPDTLARQVLKPVRANILRKARMKAFVRRLTTRHNLDRIDELDETDPFGTNYHHDGPYEAISSNLVQPTLPRIDSSTAPRRDIVYPSKHESNPHPSRAGQHQFPPRLPSAPGEVGLSLHLEPGQILQHNAIYNPHVSSITAIPDQFPHQPNPASITPRPDHSRRQSQSNPRTHSPQDPSSLDLPTGIQNRHSSSQRTLRGRHLGKYASDMPNDPPRRRDDHDAAPYVPHQTEKTVLPPPRYESTLRSSDPPRSSQRTTPPPSFHSSTESVAPTVLLHDSRKSGHSLDNFYTTNSMITQSSSSIQSRPLDPPRIHHLPKRLVMPALLQPPPPQPQNDFHPVEPPAWQEEYPNDYALEGVQHFQGKPAAYSQEPRLLRKRSSAFPAKTPIPDHAPMTQDDAVPIMGTSATKTGNEAKGTKEKTRRRRLSKRKNDV